MESKVRHCLLILLTLSTCVSGAMPLTHLFLAKQFLEKYPREGEEDAFFRGCLYPDIRYIVQDLYRKETHHKKIDIEDITAEEDPFIAGTYHHSYVDLKRTEKIKEWDINALLEAVSGDPFLDHPQTLLKVVEDEIIYDMQSAVEWWKLITLFQKEDPASITAKVSVGTVKKWNRMIQRYLLFRPSYLLTGLSLLNRPLMRVSTETIQKWEKTVPSYASDPRMRDYVSKLITAFDEDQS